MTDVKGFISDIFNVKSIFDHFVTFDPGVVSSNSIVTASVSELSHNQDDTPQVPTKGTAVLTIHNVVPSQNRIEVTIDTGWASPINVRVFFVIINN